MKYYKLLLCLFSVFSMTVAGPQKGNPADVAGVEIVEPGIYQRKIVKSPQDESTVAGKVDVVKKGQVITITDSIPAEIGVSFGFKYIIKTADKRDTKYPVKYRVIYPSAMTNPETGKTESEWEFSTFSSANKEVYTGFGFSEDYELLKGTWIFEIISGDFVAKQVFHVFGEKQE